MAIRVGGRGGANITIEDCEFINCAGRNVIGLWSPYGVGASIVNNRLRNGGHYVGTPVENLHNTDFSFIVTKWKNSRIIGNLIQQENIDIALRSWTAGIEMGGSDSVAMNNTIIGCDPAMHLPATTDPLENLQVKNNTMRDCLGGVFFWTSYPTKNVLIAGNRISLNSSPQRTERPCVGIRQPYNGFGIFDVKHANAYPVKNLEIRDNTITCNLPPGSRQPARGIELHSVEGGVVEGNTIDGLTSAGIYIVGSPWGISDLSIRKNKITNCGRGETAPVNRSGIALKLGGQSVIPAKTFFTKNLLIENNEFGNSFEAKNTPVGSVGKGVMQAAISFDPFVSPKPAATSIKIRGNVYKNIQHSVYTGTANIPLEGFLPGVHIEPDGISVDSGKR
jgi:hypothetical protein